MYKKLTRAQIQTSARARIMKVANESDWLIFARAFPPVLRHKGTVSVADRKSFASDVFFMKEKSLVKNSLSEALLGLYLRERSLVVIGASRYSP